MNTAEKIESIRRKFGKKLLILGHHYQKEDVILHTDLRGDSFQLSAAAAEKTDCEYIVFCGVHFMAETADILANRQEQIAVRAGKQSEVLIPDLEAGCPMADLADMSQVDQCWKELAKTIDISEITPITYVNSKAELKAFCGRNGGYACTSTNARAVLERALSERPRVLFLPDQHLGRNTAFKMGISLDEMPVWSPSIIGGGVSAEQLREAKIILWNGYCGVHQKFMPEQIDRIREEYPGIQVIVHPECRFEVVQKADFAGSTSMILSTIEKAPANSKWAVGTEWRMVERLIHLYPDKFICNLAPEKCLCETMNLITPENLLRSLESIETGRPQYVVQVDPAIAPDALVCLQRMLSCK